MKVWQKTYPRIDKYVPAGVVKFVQRYVGTLVYTDILSYDPQKLQRPPYEIEVISIPPVFKDKVGLPEGLEHCKLCKTMLGVMLSLHLCNDAHLSHHRCSYVSTEPDVRCCKICMMI